MAAPKSSDPGFSLNLPGSGKTPWYEDLRVIGILLMVIGVLALPLVWFNKKFTVLKKILITIVSIAIALVLFLLATQLSILLDRRATESREKREALAAQVRVPASQVDSDRPVS